MFDLGSIIVFWIPCSVLCFFIYREHAKKGTLYVADSFESSCDDDEFDPVDRFDPMYDEDTMAIHGITTHGMMSYEFDD